MKEIFGPTLQGEGAHAGRPCVFLRFAVCNLACTWCDTDFRPEGAAELEADGIVARLQAVDRNRSRLCIVSGGEPALQWDAPLASAMRDADFRVHMETNGTRELSAPVDWLTVSPKPQFHEGRFELRLRGGDECKLVVDDTVGEEDVERYQGWPFSALFLQPCQDDRYRHHLERTLDLVSRHPRWRLSLQLHKILGLP